ncbi:hypothetical protein LR48_Vigan197s001900 [Vigna angularis]|uniref:Uncharacterized protein n=1 Tax=Phaseolus angularis TaxID=3914 RepID=A0A0L9T5H0_PHAAN|nr:hypothetical protein LR48_Vigan197s001900 [Vigna angularis]
MASGDSPSPTCEKKNIQNEGAAPSQNQMCILSSTVAFHISLQPRAALLPIKYILTEREKKLQETRSDRGIKMNWMKEVEVARSWNPEKTETVPDWTIGCERIQTERLRTQTERLLRLTERKGAVTAGAVTAGAVTAVAVQKSRMI